MKFPDEGRPENWPTQAELEGQPSPAEGPYPRDHYVAKLQRCEDGTYVEQLRCYRLTRRRTEEEQISGEVPFQFTVQEGRKYRAVYGEEKADLLFYRHLFLSDPNDFKVIKLVLIPKTEGAN